MKRFRTHHWIGLVVVLGLVLGMVLPAGARPTDPARSAVIGSRAARWLSQAGADASTTFIVSFRDEGTQALVDRAPEIADRLARREQVHNLLSGRAAQNNTALRDFLTGQGLNSGVTNLEAFMAFNGVSITANKQVIRALQGWDRVAAIELEEIVHLDTNIIEAPLPQATVEWNISKIGANLVWSQLGIDGTGVVVGNLDTGVRFTHQDLSANYKCAGGSHTNCWRDSISGQAAPYDDNDHGTHTMGTAVGRNGIGVAPGATWIACKAFSSTGNAAQTDILECFDWFLAPGGSAANAPDVVNNSWGSSSGASTVYQQAVTNWVNAGIYPEFSNGNSGPGCSTVGAPGSYTNAVGTGATDINDVIASFSSRGPSPFGVIKPDLSAPGVNIRSAGGSANNEYLTISGTSMAGPHVTGLVALLLDANSSLTIAQITQNMKANALGISANACSSSGVPNNVYGWGRIRALESVQAALGGSTPTPTPTTPPATVIFSDNFETNLGWTVNPNGTDTATTGAWERGDPEATNSSGAKQLGTTVSGVNDLVTGRLAGASAGVNDIDGGVTSIRSPSFALTGGSNYSLSFSYYLAHGTNSSTADFLRVSIVGATTSVVFQELGGTENDNGVWASTTVSLNAFAGQTVFIRIEAADASTASLVEAAVDNVSVTRQ